MRRRSVLVLLAAAAVAVVGLAACGDDGGSDVSAPAEPVAGAPEFEVVGDALEFEPSEFAVPAGDFTVTFTSADIPHDFTLEGPDGDVRLDAGAGQTESGGFAVDEPGEYTFYCSVPGHRSGGMEGTLTVE
jgi:plastocyanin